MCGIVAGFTRGRPIVDAPFSVDALLWMGVTFPTLQQQDVVGASTGAELLFGLKLLWNGVPKDDGEVMAVVL